MNANIIEQESETKRELGPGKRLWTLQRAMAVAAAAALLTSCATKVLIVADPQDANVEIRVADAARAVVGPAPLQAKVDFKKGRQSYAVQVTPIPSLEERYSGASIALNEQDYAGLPLVDNNPKLRRLDVKLDEKAYTLVPYVEVVLDSRRTWRGVITPSRSFKDISEQGGAVPTLITDLGEDIGIQSMSLSPDGVRIIYSLATYYLSLEEIRNLFRVMEPRVVDIAGANLYGLNTGGGGVEHITSENFRDLFPTFTPDGQRLLFASNRRRAGSEDILMISAVRRSGISDIYVHRDARILRPTQAQDGTIAFAVDEPNPIDARQRFTVWTLGGPNQFPTQIQIGSQPAISPDGKQITFIGKDDNLWVVDSDGSRATQLTTDAENIMKRYRESLSIQEMKRYDWFLRELGVTERVPYSFPSWSKDGRFILYTGMEGSDPTGRPNEDIWVMRPDRSDKRQLTTNGSIDRYPLLSPDGKWVYFMSNRGGRWAIWRIQAQLTPSTDAASSSK